MKKLRLSLDALRVDSFTTDATAAMRGTVRGESIIEPSGYTYCIPCGGHSDPCSTSCVGESCRCDEITPNTTCDM